MTNVQQTELRYHRSPEWRRPINPWAAAALAKTGHLHQSSMASEKDGLFRWHYRITEAGADAVKRLK